MSEYVKNLMAEVKAKNPAEPEFHQAVEEVAESLSLVLDRHPEYRAAKILERINFPGINIEQKSTNNEIGDDDIWFETFGWFWICIGFCLCGFFRYPIY